MPIVIPYQQLIHTSLYLLYGNDKGSFSYTGKLCTAVQKRQKGKNRQVSVLVGFLNTDIYNGVIFDKI